MHSTYTKATGQMGCCISEGTYHQFCECCGQTISKCKFMCNLDNQCKGYFHSMAPLRAKGPNKSCHYATTSECPTGCTTYSHGNIGDLNSYSTCATKLPSPFMSRGCFIKSSSKVYNL